MKNEWEDEPNYLTWEYKKLKCEIVRNTFGCWCGYVILPKDHPYLNEKFQEMNFLDMETKVHGGISYLDEIRIGFDCSHANDIKPTTGNPRDFFDMKVNKRLKKEKPTYKNMNFAIKQTEILADEVTSKIE